MTFTNTCSTTKTTSLASHKKAQLTIYIGLALLILLLAGIVLYIQRVKVRQELEATVRRIIVTPESQPMQDYITQCLEKTASDGIQSLSSHGGWITPTSRVNTAYPTEGEAVAFDPTSDQHIPYWYFLSSPNACTGTCTFAGLEPPLKKPAANNMESQLDTYITQNLKECLGDFTTFVSEGYTVSQQGPLTVATTIFPNTITVYATYPLRFDKPETTASTNEIFTAINAKLGAMHQFADDITRLERDHRFLEKHARQLIDLSSGLGPEQLPPIYEVEFQFASGTTWTKTNVKNRIKDLLSTYTPFLQIFDTANYRPIIAPLHHPDPKQFDRLYNRNMLLINNEEKTYPQIEARFIYLPWWEPYFDLNCQGEECKPEVLLNTLGIQFGIQRYLFTYDLSFPVLVELKDPDAFQGRGLVFNFMLEANLRNNEPMLGTFNPIQMDYGLGASLFCDQGQLNGRNLTLTVFDGKTTGPVPDASLLYTCGTGTHPNASSCTIGTSDHAGIITSALPVCIGGTATIFKEGYGSSSFPFDSDVAGTTTISKTLEPIRQVAINVKRQRLLKTPQGWQLGEEPVGLDSTEQATVSLQRINSRFEDEFFATAQQFGDVVQDAQSGQHTSVGLLPGNYTVDIITIQNPSPAIIIPVQRRCYENKCQDIPSQPIVFDDTNPLLSGGAHYTYEVRKEDLDRHDTITLYAIDAAIELISEQERIVEDMDVIGDISQLSTAYRAKIEPAWG